VKEITEDEEFSGYIGLTRHHYRGRDVAGRTARLVVRSFDPLYPSVLGYIELATPFFMNKARSVVFDAPFKANGLAWERWDKKALRTSIHSLVRIARCVVSPEFRGVGLGQLLVKHAIRFARDRWQMAGLKPCFLEITADMLRFVPFAQKAGMTFIGETQGNLGRVVKDMSYLVRVHRRVQSGSIVKEDSCGIVDQQVSRMSRALSLMRREGWNREEFITKLNLSATRPSLRSHRQFAGILSMPKPTYSVGLVPEAQEFLGRRVHALQLSNGKQPRLPVIVPLLGTIRVRSLSISFTSSVQRRRRTHDIEKAFGISPENIVHPVVSNLSFECGPGVVVLITGSSGSGKTSLLGLLSRSRKSRSRTVSWPRNARIATFSPLRSRKPLIEALGITDTESALYLMGAVGLSDVYVYLKRFSELSAGQQYRAMLAKAISSGANVWMADEFCANLDAVTANVVAEGVQKLARRLGSALIVASSHPHLFLRALRPDVVIQLSSSNEHAVHSGPAFVEAVRGPLGSRIPTFAISRKLMARLRASRRGLLFVRSSSGIHVGLAHAECGAQLEIIRIEGSRNVPVSALRARHARLAGFGSVESMRRSLSGIGLGVGRGSVITAIAVVALTTRRKP
jgi:ABC-type ATPase with predicted acetyltransferase domain